MLHQCSQVLKHKANAPDDAIACSDCKSSLLLVPEQDLLAILQEAQTHAEHVSG
jgi:hypothetical protein